MNRKGAKVRENDSRYRAPALEKGLDVLELLAAQTEPMTLTAIVKQLGRSHGELFRMVQVLEQRGFIEQEPGREGYRLTDRLFSLGMQQPRTRILLELALPVMRGGLAAAALTVPYLEKMQSSVSTKETAELVRQAADRISAQLVESDSRI